MEYFFPVNATGNSAYYNGNKTFDNTPAELFQMAEKGQFIGA
jgi:hypothetical protein